jgi:hypothetical protein
VGLGSDARFVSDGEWADISGHEVAIGNENLSKEQVQTFYRFA